MREEERERAEPGPGAQPQVYPALSGGAEATASNRAAKP